MNSQKGFTLIELVVVIVILGILAAVAAPKFIDISSDARIATLEGVEGAVKGGNSMLLAKARIEGTEAQANDDRTTATIDGINAHYGEALATVNDVAALLDLSNPDAQTGISGDWRFEMTTVNNGPNTVQIRPADLASDAVCFLTYTEATNASTPATVEITANSTSGC